MYSRHWAVLGTAALVALGAAGCGKSASDSTPTAKATAKLSPTTTAAKGDTGAVTWATYREVETLDPIYAFDYPENTVITSMCDSLLQQQPDGSIQAGPRVESTRPTTDARHHAQRRRRDVLGRQAAHGRGRRLQPRAQHEPELAAASTAAVFQQRDVDRRRPAPTEVTIKLSSPTTGSQGELSQMPGIVRREGVRRGQGQGVRHADGGTMCTGAVQARLLEARRARDGRQRNDAYWDTALSRRRRRSPSRACPTTPASPPGLLTSEIDGTYPQPLTTLDQLKSSDAVTVTPGPSFASDALIISSLKGALGDVKVRQALSLAIDRKAYINSLYTGEAQLPRDARQPGHVGLRAATCSRPTGTRCPSRPRTSTKGKAADQGRRRDRQDDRPRHEQRDQLAPDRRQRRPPGRRSASG